MTSLRPQTLGIYDLPTNFRKAAPDAVTLLRDLLTAAARETDSLREELARLRATTPAAGRSLDVAALIREDRDGR